MFVFIFECPQLGDFRIVIAGLKPETVPAINAPLQLGRDFCLRDTVLSMLPFRHEKEHQGVAGVFSDTPA